MYINGMVACLQLKHCDVYLHSQLYDAIGCKMTVRPGPFLDGQTCFPTQETL